MINQEQIDHFNTKGYVAVENIVSKDVIDSIRDEYSQLMDRCYDLWFRQGLVPAVNGEASFFDKLDCAIKAGFDWYQPLDISLPQANITADTLMHIGPAVFNLIRHDRLLDIVEQLIGPEISSNPIQHVRIKPPLREVETNEKRAHVIATDWHQDKGVTLEEADETTFITIWIAITDATVENGCLQVADGNYSAMLPHCAKDQVTIPDQFLDTATPRPLPIKSGGVIIFHPLTPHCSLSNVSDQFRWSFDLRYHVTGQPSGRSVFPEFVARSRRDPASVLNDWRTWGNMWEDAKQRLCEDPEVKLHRWGNDAHYCA